ncbi:hypothetical protein ABZU94_29860 [Streptomyces mirabilis]|uniref:hypothetical protein n=1 Tax=Streptomyces sp. NPDC005388 TaxID=3156717 RepID=UPI0033AA4A33
MARGEAWDAAPILMGFLGRRRIDPAGWRHACVWCSWCATWHGHGDDTTIPGDVLHRASHCHIPDGPYEGHGYRIVVTNVPLSDVYRQMRQPTAKQIDAMHDRRTTPAIDQLRAQTIPLLEAQR